jgi:hypothetical protein
MLRDEFARRAQEQTAPLDDDAQTLVRGSRYNGKARILRRMQVGVLSSLELEDASPVSAALLSIHKWVERIAEHEMARITAKCERYAARGQAIPPWVLRGMDEGFRRVEQIEHRVQMLFGIFAAYRVLPLEFKPADSVVRLLMQHLRDLEAEAEAEAEAKGGMQQVLAGHFARVYKVAMPQAA